jgi:hypothetical protein
MPSSPRSTFRPALALLAVALAAVALAAVALATSPAGAADRTTAAPGGGHHVEQRLVVRGDATAVDGPCDARVCTVKLTDGRFRGTPIGSGAYSGSIRLKIGAAFPTAKARSALRSTGASCSAPALPIGSSSPSRATPARTAPGP